MPEKYQSNGDKRKRDGATCGNVDISQPKVAYEQKKLLKKIL